LSQTHDVEASTSHAAPPAPDVTVAHPEQVLRRADAPPAHFNEPQAEQALWKEFRDHGVSINNTLTEALQIHGGPSIRVFEEVLSVGFETCSSPFLRLGVS
jgi:hypothetical protein